jgi:uncharacterized membrane protein YozB (DUF420 family)
MSVFGSPSIAKDRVPWNKTISEGQWAVIAVGIVAGILVAYARTPMHLPGHKALLWMAPILAARLVTRTFAGASVGALVTALTALSLGGRIAGGIGMMPLVVLAGVVLDAGVELGERRKFAWRKVIILMAFAGLVANLICFLKRLFDPTGSFLSSGNLQDLLFAGTWHAIFGFIAGLLGAVAGHAILRLGRSSD